MPRHFGYLRPVHARGEVVGMDWHYVDAAAVEFGPAHVIFRDSFGAIVLAERVDQVNELREVSGE